MFRRPPSSPLSSSSAASDVYKRQYPHYLCAMTDAALGETDRYAGEQAQYNGILAELAAWLRRTYPPRACTRWQW